MELGPRSHQRLRGLQLLVPWFPHRRSLGVPRGARSLGRRELRAQDHAPLVRADPRRNGDGDMRRLRLGLTTKIWVLLAVGLSLAKLNHMLAVDWCWAVVAPLAGALGSVLVATYSPSRHEDHDDHR